MEAQDAITEEELVSVVREMPQFDVAAVDVGLQRDFWTLLGKALTKRRVMNQLQRKIGSTLSKSFHSYGRLFESWCRRTLEKLRRQFEAHADGYRAQLERLTGSATANSDEIHAIRLDLNLLSQPPKRETLTFQRPTNSAPEGKRHSLTRANDT